MALPQIKTDEERARLDFIFAEIEVQRNAPAEVPKCPTAPVSTQAFEDRFDAMELREIVGNAVHMLEAGAFKTKWERVLAKALIRAMEEPKNRSAINTELNLLRNFATAVEHHLDAAERAAKEQDNHHYYKVFSGKVRALLGNL